MVLRIEDLDRERSKQCWIDQVQRDFEMLGITWDEGPYFQHDRDEAYARAFDTICEAGKVYPCFCTRADLHAASAPHRGEKLVYPGTCRRLTSQEVNERLTVRAPSWRVLAPNREYALDDLVQGHFTQNLERDCGDFVIRRADGLFAYQLAVVVDDAEQGIDCIVRGMDLLVSTPQQVFLQDLLDLPHATYAHIPLLVSQQGRRLSKRDHDAGLDELTKRFGSPEAIIGHIAALVGLIDKEEPLTCEDLLSEFRMSLLEGLFPDKVQIQWQ